MIMKDEFKYDLRERIRETDPAIFASKGLTAEEILNDAEGMDRLWTWYQKGVEEYETNEDFAYRNALFAVYGIPVDALSCAEDSQDEGMAAKPIYVTEHVLPITIIVEDNNDRLYTICAESVQEILADQNGRKAFHTDPWNRVRFFAVNTKSLHVRSEGPAKTLFEVLELLGNMGVK